MNTQLMQINFERLKQTIEKSAQIGTIPNQGLRRLALAEEDKAMREIFMEWLQDADLETSFDDFGNMYGRRKGKEELSPVLIGSHLDTQPNGGRFDGVLGVLTALEVVRSLEDYQIETRRPIVVVNFTNEEGARFEPPLLGSGGLTGIFDRDFVYSRKDREGHTFEEELTNIGFKGEQADRINQLHSYLELHIEQGPILENEQVSIGAVDGVQGMTWFELTVKGEGGHAGPTPMSVRKDALLAASKLMLQIEEKAEQFDPGISFTIGQIQAKPDVINCIPEEVVFSLDIRHIDDAVREEFITEIEQNLKSNAAKLHVDLSIEKLWEVKTTVFHPKIVSQVIHSANKSDYSVKQMYSGAGHDAKYMSEVAPTGMIFLPSVGGKSHVESELTLDKDIEKGANVLLDSVIQLANMESDLESME